MKCEYGCGQTATFKQTNNKMCCSKHYSQCNAVKEKNKRGLSLAHKEGRLSVGNLANQGWAKNKTFVTDNRIQSSYSIDEIFSINKKVSRSKVRNLVKKLNLIEYKCSDCDNDGLWRNKKLQLHLDHINGIRYDHRLENLRWLCPNCHSQTETFCKNTNLTKVTDDMMIEELKKSKTIREALCNLGLSDGTNYYRAKRLKSKI